jgi:FKBP12-rapamycin complex-associated protein
MISSTVRRNRCASCRSRLMVAIEGQGEPGAQEVRNERALFVYNRVQHKLTGQCKKFADVSKLTYMPFAGRDFNPDVTLSVSAQVDKLIIQATSLENLCQCFSGW